MFFRVRMPQNCSDVSARLSKRNKGFGAERSKVSVYIYIYMYIYILVGGRGKTKARLLGSGKDKEDVGQGGRRLSRYIEWGIATLKSTVASL